MNKIPILCPDCGKLIVKISADSTATIYGWCKKCRQEKTIKCNRADVPQGAKEPFIS